MVAAADIFVMPSLSEGLPLALLEAMVAGSAIVATVVGEVSAALEQGAAGVLVPPGDPRALAVAIERLLNDQQLARTLGAPRRLQSRGRIRSLLDGAPLQLDVRRDPDTLNPSRRTLQ